MANKQLISIFSNLRQRLRLTAGNIAGQESADDALQDAFCKLWTHPKIPDDEQQLEKIAMTTVKNISIDYQRQSSRHPSSQLSGAERIEADDGKETEERFRQVKQIIESQLNEMQRQVLWMRDYEDYSFADIAEELGTSEANVRKILSRARKTVREVYVTLNTKY